MALCTLFHDLLWDNSKSKMYKTPVHVPTSVLRKCHPQSLLQVVTSKTGRMMATSKFKEGVVFLGPCHQYPSFFLDDTASTKHSLASQRHSSLCLIQQNIAELPRRAEAEAMCDQKKIPLLIDLVRPSSCWRMTKPTTNQKA